MKAWVCSKGSYIAWCTVFAQEGLFLLFPTLQELFGRVTKFDSASSMTLEMLPVKLDHSSLRAASKIDLMKWEKKKMIGTGSGVITCVNNQSNGLIVSTEATLRLDTSLADACYRCKNKKRENPVHEEAIDAGQVTSRRKRRK